MCYIFTFHRSPRFSGHTHFWLGPL
ncbi:hypothetical protein VULLAG_LOCUS7121 [Vulpes lagopus]